MIIGLTGGIGSGKSTVLAMFNDLGVPTTSADKFSKIVIDQNPHILQAIIDRFNTSYIKPDHTLDRQKLRHKIFSSVEDRVWLENILHPLIKQKIIEYAQAQTYPYCVIEIPLLIEANMHDSVDKILCIDCPIPIQIERASKRDKCKAAETQAIIDSQLTRQERIAGSDDVLENHGDLELLKQAVLNLHNTYLSLAASKNN